MGALEIYRFIFYGRIFCVGVRCVVYTVNTRMGEEAHLSHNQGAHVVNRGKKNKQETKSVKLLFYAVVCGVCG